MKTRDTSKATRKIADVWGSKIDIAATIGVMYTADFNTAKQYFPLIIVRGRMGRVFNRKIVRLSLAKESHAGGRINTDTRYVDRRNIGSEKRSTDELVREEGNTT
jgi:hypothetical protein